MACEYLKRVGHLLWYEEFGAVSPPKPSITLDKTKKQNYFRALEINQRQTINSEKFVPENLLKLHSRTVGACSLFLLGVAPIPSYHQAQSQEH